MKSILNPHSHLRYDFTHTLCRTSDTPNQISSTVTDQVGGRQVGFAEMMSCVCGYWLLFCVCCFSFGNVTDVLFDECTIGDDEGSSPHAFFFKMHSNCGNATKVQCRIGDVVVRNTKLGRIRNNTWQDAGHRGDFAIEMAMSYADPPIDPSLPQPVISNISFINVTATETLKVTWRREHAMIRVGRFFSSTTRPGLCAHADALSVRVRGAGGAHDWLSQ